jgi:hypothetical protein
MFVREIPRASAAKAMTSRVNSSWIYEATREQWKYKLGLWRLERQQAEQERPSANAGLFKTYRVLRTHPRPG